MQLLDGQVRSKIIVAVLHNRDGVEANGQLKVLNLVVSALLLKFARNSYRRIVDVSLTTTKLPESIRCLLYTSDAADDSPPV